MQIRKNRRKKRIIGLLFLIALGYFILTNFDLGDLPWVGLAIEGPKQTCTEIRGPKTMTDTEVSTLKVDDMGFKALRNENKAVLEVRNTDDVSGDVRVTVYCVNGDQQGEQKKTLEPGETGVFSFLDVRDCDLDYIVEPELIKTRVNKTVYVTDSVCE